MRPPRRAWFLAPLASVPVAIACGDPFTVAPSGSDAGGPADSGAPIDSPSDAPADAGQRWCLQQSGVHTFCDDFDDPNESTSVGRFDSPPLVQGTFTGPAIDGLDFVSAPRSLVGRSNKTDANLPSTVSALVKLLSLGDIQTIDLHFSLRIDADCFLQPTTSGGPTVTPFGFYIGAPGGITYLLVVVAQPSQSTLVEEELGTDGGPTGVPSAHPLAHPIDIGQWESIQFQFSQQNHTVSMLVKGSPVLTNETMGYTFASLGKPLLVVGANLGQADTWKGDCRVRFDNVIADVE